MPAPQHEALEQHVDSALQEVLGYPPAPNEDLSELDSLQRLEILVVLEERAGLPFDDEALVGDWWSDRTALTAYLSSRRVTDPPAQS